MRSELCLCFTLALASAGVCEAQQTIPPAAPPAATAAAPTDAVEPAIAQTPKSDEQVQPHTLRKLPPDVDPNPPKAEDLKLAAMTWKGEYEADAIGLPLLGPDGRPVPVLYNKKGKRVKSRIKIPKTHPITIVAGTLTVDGWTGKAHLNYSIPDLRYIYLSAPLIGTVIVSQQAFPGAAAQKAAFEGRTLTVSVGEHQIQLASDKPLIGKVPLSAWVKVDPDYREDPRYPVMGYGSTRKSPYEWPGAKRDKALGALNPPPLPKPLQPKLEEACSGAPCAKPAPSPQPKGTILQ